MSQKIIFCQKIIIFNQRRIFHAIIIQVTSQEIISCYNTFLEIIIYYLKLITYFVKDSLALSLFEKDFL